MQEREDEQKEKERMTGTLRELIVQDCKKEVTTKQLLEDLPIGIYNTTAPNVINVEQEHYMQWSLQS